jgi:hypothetical protein
MPRKILSILPWLLLAAVGAYFAAGYGLDRVTYPLDRVFESPDGKYRVFEFGSMSDGAGHAPYGTNLTLTRKGRISSPADGYVIFGGYCKGRVGVEWKGNTRLDVYCEQGDAVRTQATRAYGIDIEVVNAAAR